MTRRNCCAGPGSKVDAPEASAGPGWEIQEVSRVGAQGVTSKSKLLAREMPRVCSACLQAIWGLKRAGRADPSPNAAKRHGSADRTSCSEPDRGQGAPAPRASPPDSSISGLNHQHRAASTSRAFQKCFGSLKCQAAAESGKAPRACHLLRLGHVADPTTATVRTGRSSTGRIRGFETRFILQIAHFGSRVHCGRRRGTFLYRSCRPARL